MLGQIVAIIPARGGSKGIPRKNLQPLGGKPLVAWTIEAALAATGIDAVYVSTEDTEIAEVARCYGAEVIERPVELAMDTASSESVIIHALQVLGDTVDIVAFIQPTSPFLKPEIIDQAIALLSDPRYDSVITVEEDYGYYGTLDTEGCYHPFRKERKRRQEMVPFYRDNGALYLAPRQIFLEGRRMGERVGVVVMSAEDSLEIDTSFDLLIAEQIAALRLAAAQGVPADIEDITKIIKSEMHQAAKTIEQASRVLVPRLAQAAQHIVEAYREGHKLLVMGNGGSAADAQHMVAELVGRFRHNHRPLPALALTTDTSVLTAVGNDFGFEHVFARQVDAWVQPGDVVIGISTSGNSANVVQALHRARQAGAFTIGLTGQGGGKVGQVVHLLLDVPATDTARIQEVHAVLLHTLCALIERWTLLQEKPAEEA